MSLKPLGMAASLLAAAAFVLTPALVGAADHPVVALSNPPAYGLEDGTVVSSDGARHFASWEEYYRSDYFRSLGIRCGTPFMEGIPESADNPSDCTLSFNNPLAIYEPDVIYRVPVVVHIIMRTTGEGAISDATVESQIQVLNEDYQAIAGSLGEPGYDVKFEFFLATEDPDGNPTTGITRTTNNTWYNDQGTYWTSLAWDTNRYLNIYTNSAGGYLGYSYFAQYGLAGSADDRVVIYWEAFGLTSFVPYDLGRTATHEIGHYMGLYHTFEGGCGTGSSPGCYSSGDLICDTNSEANPRYDCPSPYTSCGTLDPIHNYMDYAYDICMNQFTHEQARRMRCAIEGYRPDLYSTEATDVAFPVLSTRGTALALRAGVPNPFTPQTTLRYTLPGEAPVSLAVYDQQGRLVRSLVDGVQSAGDHEVTWRGEVQDGRHAAPGVYFLRLEANGESRSQKVVLER
jgi:hypothetical protein